LKHPDLFAPEPFLESKLGASFFDDIPQEPGVYRFYDSGDSLLYVGKAKNLRRRLFTYKRARPGRTSTKTSKLLSRIHSLQFDTVESEEEALLLENHWIRKARPEYNHANKHTETYYYIAIAQLEGAIRFSLSMQPAIYRFQNRPETDLLSDDHVPTEPIQEAKLYGCFKGHRPVRAALGTLLKLLWMTLHHNSSPHSLPVQLSRNLTPLRYRLLVPGTHGLSVEKVAELLDDWFTGRSPEILYQLSNREMTFHSLFDENYHRDSLEYLRSYYARILARQQRMRLRHQPEPGRELIGQHELDDLFVKEGG
jgi:predicted GIY-YIG superfamily endonuclease